MVVLAGALLRQSLTLLGKGVHPSVIAEALHKASDKAVEVSRLRWIFRACLKKSGLDHCSQIMELMCFFELN